MTVTDQLAVKQGTSSSTSGRRWVVPTVASLAAAVVVGLAVLVGWAWNYQPLESGTWTGVVGERGAQVRAVENYFGTDYRIVRAEQGSTVKVLMSLGVDPDAPTGVTVNSVGSPVPLTGGDMVGFADASEASSRLERPVGADRQEGNLANGPVALDPGDLLYVTITLTLPQCNGDGTRDGGSSFGNEVPVDYSAFGASHTTNIPLGYALTFADTPTCPVR